MVETTNQKIMVTQFKSQKNTTWQIHDGTGWYWMKMKHKNKTHQSKMALAGLRMRHFTYR